MTYYVIQIGQYSYKVMNIRQYNLYCLHNSRDADLENDSVYESKDRKESEDYKDALVENLYEAFQY